MEPVSTAVARLWTGRLQIRTASRLILFSHFVLFKEPPIFVEPYLISVSVSEAVSCSPRTTLKNLKFIKEYSKKIYQID